MPPPLKDVTLLSLDVGLLQAGASMKGEFEQRLRQVIEEVQASPKPIILFIDEAHTLVGAGGAAGTGDAANLLKPALARGTLRTIAATTWAEYKKHIEKDPALTRRFQVVQVGEPSEEKAILMMRGVASTMEKHHRVQLLDEAIEAAVRLSHRYIPSRQLPDKSVSLLDTACARVAISQHAVPPEVEDCRQRIEALETELEIIGRESAVGIDTPRNGCATANESLEADRATCSSSRRAGTPRRRWSSRSWRSAAGCAAAPARSRAPPARSRRRPTQRPVRPQPRRRSATPSARSCSNELHGLQAQLHELQGDPPLILPTVDEQAVAAVVQDWTGIPVGRMVKNEIETVLKLADTLEQRIIGQRHALDMIARRIQTSRAEPRQPQQADRRVHARRPFRRRQDGDGAGAGRGALRRRAERHHDQHERVPGGAHGLARSRARRPGYVGYGEGGVLTEAVRRRPYSVVLLDEVEKAHPDVHEIFFQVFDKGWMEDGEGRLIDFKNTLILLTTNAGTDLIANMCKDPELMPEPEGMAKALREPLLKVFPPALLGRLVVIPYYPLSDEMIGAIVRLQLRRIDAAHPREPQRALHLRRRRGQAHRQPLHRDRKRRTHDRRHPDQYRPAEDQRGVPEAHDRRTGDRAGARLGGEGGIRLRFRLARQRGSGSLRRP